MKITYFVYHDETAKSQLDAWQHPFSKEKVENEYVYFLSCFKDYFGKSLKFDCVYTETPQPGFIVTLEDNCISDHLRDTLTSALRSHNSKIPGLCIVGTELDPQPDSV